ncbi:hypothetical protein B296_00041888 [Ensete ventricosum]|uniref:Uncharacterized protein n=1 Tax=Ensete ventricosum TaxID=4639 RepID=A0A426YJQ5_ENSVE|nr:hypothetical protein B296_00041888 [Ensete ventricosum]
MTSTLTGFTDDAIALVGFATLPVTFGDEPRTKTLMNARADALARSASTDAVDELSTIPSLCQLTVTIVEMATTAAHLDWREEMLHYKKDATLPTDEITSQRIKRTEVWFDTINGRLYKRAFSQPLLRCLLLVTDVLQANHASDGICDTLRNLFAYD